jgi:SAM-dependent methyltransferase
MLTRGGEPVTSNDPRTDVINRQYEKWPYPEPIQDLDTWRANAWQWYDPSLSHRVLWPDRDYKPDLDILIAGCGTNQAACFAYGNPEAKVLGVDVSQRSLDHQQYLKDKHGLTNLELRRLPIEELPTLGRDFDLVVSTGVLMILADPLVGLKALGQCVRRDGAIALMLYAQHGRFGVYLLQSVFRTLGLKQDDASLDMVKETVSLLPADHPFRSYAAIAPDLADDAGLVDTFLIGRDVGFTVEDCVDLVDSAGLAFQGWLFNSPYHPHTVDAPHSTLYPAINALPEREMWSVMERIYPRNGCQFFIACRRDRPVSSYKIDFSTADSLLYVPEMRFRAGLDGAEIFRNDWRMRLDDQQLAFMQHVDGTRTISDIAKLVIDSGTTQYAGIVDAEAFARELFESLWRLDFVAVKLTPKPNPLFRTG